MPKHITLQNAGSLAVCGWALHFEGMSYFSPWSIRATRREIRELRESRKWIGRTARIVRVHGSLTRMEPFIA